MKTLRLEKFPRLLNEFNQRLIDSTISNGSHSYLCQLMKEWYNIEPVIDEFGFGSSFTLSENDATMFILKWS